MSNAWGAAAPERNAEMGWGTSKVMGVWVVFHTVALGLIEMLRYWSQVRACGSFWSSVFRALESPSFGGSVS